MDPYGRSLLEEADLTREEFLCLVPSRPELLSASAEQADHLVAELGRGEGQRLGPLREAQKSCSTRSNAPRICATRSPPPRRPWPLFSGGNRLDSSRPGNPRSQQVPEHWRLAGEASETAGTAREAGYMSSH